MLYAVCFAIFFILIGFLWLLYKSDWKGINRNYLKVIYFNILVMLIILAWVLIKYTLLKSY